MVLFTLCNFQTCCIRQHTLAVPANTHGLKGLTTVGLRANKTVIYSKLNNEAALSGALGALAKVSPLVTLGHTSYNCILSTTRAH